MVRRTHSQLSTAKPKEFFPEVAEKKCILVGDQTPRKSMVFTHHLHEQRRNFMGSMLSWENAKMSSFGKTVNHGKDDSVSVGRRETGDEING